MHIFEASFQTRRKFIGSLSALSLMSFDKVVPELILYNGNVHTINNVQPHAEAIAIANGRLLAVGTNSDILKMATGTTKKVDLGKKTVVPHQPA